MPTASFLPYKWHPFVVFYQVGIGPPQQSLDYTFVICNKWTSVLLRGNQFLIFLIMRADRKCCGAMKLLAFSDWRTQSSKSLRKAIRQYKPDCLLYAGDDLCRFFQVEDSILFKTKSHSILSSYPSFKPKSKDDYSLFDDSFYSEMSAFKFPKPDIAIAAFDLPFYFVNGNDDTIINKNGLFYLKIEPSNDIYWPEVAETDEKINVTGEFDFDSTNTDNKYEFYIPVDLSFGKFSILNKVEVVSIFGSQCTKGLNSKIVNVPDEHADIYISHIPPYGALDLSARFDVKHLGSKNFRSAIKKYKPKMVVCGHSHIWGGSITKIGETQIVNISSHDNNGAPANFALIDTKSWEVDIIKQSNPLVSMRGLRHKKKQAIDKIWESSSKVTAKLVKPLDEINSTGQKRLLSCLEELNNYDLNTMMVAERIKSLRWKKPKIIKRLSFNPAKYAFVDVETGLARGHESGHLWLIGVLFKEEIQHFKVPEHNRRFVSFLNKNKIKGLVSWTRYDHDALWRLTMEAHGNIKFIDACQRVANCVIWNSYKLHELYEALFQDKLKNVASDSDNYDISGLLAGLYADHVIIPSKRCVYCPSKSKLESQIIEKNIRDLNEMAEICQLLWKIYGKTWTYYKKKYNLNIRLFSEFCVIF
jgi:Icc-related predicted phosphoesterase